MIIGDDDNEPVDAYDPHDVDENLCLNMML
jgi:hypothetical protein